MDTIRYAVAFAVAMYCWHEFSKQVAELDAAHHKARGLFWLIFIALALSGAVYAAVMVFISLF